MSTITIPASRELAGATGTILAKLPRWFWGAAALLVAGAILAGLLLRTRSNVSLITTPVTQTTLVASVTASGTVNPQNLISVGTQVSGTIASIDVDYNSKVTRGEVLTRLDPSTFDAQLEQAEAALAQARSQVTQAAASANGAASGITVASANAVGIGRNRVGQGQRHQNGSGVGAGAENRRARRRTPRTRLRRSEHG